MLYIDVWPAAEPWKLSAWLKEKMTGIVVRWTQRVVDIAFSAFITVIEGFNAVAFLTRWLRNLFGCRRCQFSRNHQVHFVRPLHRRVHILALNNRKYPQQQLMQHVCHFRPTSSAGGCAAIMMGTIMRMLLLRLQVCCYGVARVFWVDATTSEKMVRKRYPRCQWGPIKKTQKVHIRTLLKGTAYIFWPSNSTNLQYVIWPVQLIHSPHKQQWHASLSSSFCTFNWDRKVSKHG